MNVTLFEDFVEQQLMLAANSGSTGSNSRIDGVGGVVEIITGAAANNWRQLQTRSKNIESKLSPIFSAFLRTKQSDNLETFIGLADNDAGSASNLIGFYRTDSGSAGNWNARVKSGGTGADQSLGVTGNTNFIEMIVQASPTQVVFFLDGRLVHVATANIPSALMYLVLWIKTTTGATRTLVVDYVQLSAAR